MRNHETTSSAPRGLLRQRPGQNHMSTRMVVVVALALTGCAPIEHTTTVSQTLDRQMVAGPGDLIVHVDRERNLENVFGASDIWGRKTAEGFSELHFSGIENDGTIVLY